MNRRNSGLSGRAIIAALGSIVITLMLSGTAFAQLTNYETIVTFGGPIEVPGSSPQVLPAGTYMFKVVDSKVNRNIVQISNKDDTHVYTTILAVPTHRDEESDKTIITFDERPAGSPPAIRAWFYPHEKSGQEFVYPKDKAAELARSSHSTVPYSESTSVNAAAEGTPQTVNISTSTQAPQAPQSSIFAITAAGATVEPGQNNSSAPATPSRASNNAQNSQRTEPVQTASLPQTGSDMPLLALIGSCSLFAGVSIKVIRALCVR